MLVEQSGALGGRVRMRRVKVQTHTSSRAMPPLPSTITRRAVASRHFMACGTHTKRHMLSNEDLQKYLQLS